MTTCPVCHASGSVACGEGLFRCQQCTHIFQFPPNVTVTYGANYLATYDRYPTDCMSHLRLGFLKAFVGNGRLLDVGYGKGDFVRTALKGGFDAFGCDIHGVQSDVREIAFNNDTSEWDVVTFFDSLEHFPDFSPVKSLLLRARYVMVSVPLPPPDFPENRGWKHYKPGEHLHYFSETSLCMLIGKEMRRSSDMEDTVRGRCSHGQNILTALFASGS